MTPSHVKRKYDRALRQAEAATDPVIKEIFYYLTHKLWWKLRRARRMRSGG